MSRYSNWATGIMNRVFFFQKERLLSLPSPDSDAKLASAFINVGVKTVAAYVCLVIS